MFIIIIITSFFGSYSVQPAIIAKRAPSDADKLTKAYIDHGMEIAAKVHRIPLRVLRAVCYVESLHNPRAIKLMDGLTPSYGLCQIKLATAQKNGYKHGFQGLMDAHTNALYAAKELARWWKLAKGDWRIAVTSYNKGHYSTKKFNIYTGLVAIAIGERR